MNFDGRNFSVESNKEFFFFEGRTAGSLTGLNILPHIEGVLHMMWTSGRDVFKIS